jgi:hypothetical protein
MIPLKNRISILIRKHFFPTNQKIFNTLPGDVFLVSYPRSGNTWMRYLLASLLEPDLEWNINSISRLIPDLHDKWPDDYLKPSPRVIKSHFPYQKAYKKVIYPYRDGRDVAISHYDYQKRFRVMTNRSIFF